MDRSDAVTLEGRRTLITAPAVEPVSATEAKAHLRVDGSDEDTLIASLITAARQEVEKYTGRALITQTWEVSGPAFPWGGAAIELPRPPLQTVSSVSYLDAAGDTQVWASSNYTVDAPAGDFAPKGMIIPTPAAFYPATVAHPLAVTVRFVAGFGDAGSDVPEVYRRALLVLLAHLFENREAVVTGAIAVDIPQSFRTLLASPARVEWGVG